MSVIDGEDTPLVTTTPPPNQRAMDYTTPDERRWASGEGTLDNTLFAAQESAAAFREDDDARGEGAVNGDATRTSGGTGRDEGETRSSAGGGLRSRTNSGVPRRRYERRPSQINKNNPNAELDPELKVKNTRPSQEGGRELLVSRFSHTEARAAATDVAVNNKPFKRVGAPLAEDDYDDYGQWVTEANNTFDSLDFDDYETMYLQEARARKQGHVDPPKWQMWLIIVLAGIATGLVAFGIDMGIKYLMMAKFMAASHFLETPSQHIPRPNATNATAVAETKGDDVMESGTAMVVYVLINLAYVSVAAALVIFGEPLAKGSGIGEIKCFLNGIRLFRVVRLKTLCCKALGILFSVASGLPCGKEGPMIHSGACIAAGVSTGKSSKFHWDSGFFKEFRSDRNKRNFVTAGAAAGVGVAFGAPIGGLLFAVEEVGSFWSLELTVMVFLCAAVGPWVLQLLSHPGSSSGSVQGLIDFGQIVGEYHYYDLPFVALLGILGGLIGAGFIKANMIQTRWRRINCKTKGRRFLEVLIVSFLVSVGLMLLVTYGYNCVPVPPAEEDPVLTADLKGYGCYQGEYNDMATYYFRSMEDTIHLLTHSNKHISYKTLLLHFLVFYPLTIMTYGIHVPSGLFLPSLALGCTFGHIYAQLWNLALGEDTLDPSFYALFGATAVLGGLVRMTISVIVIIMEATANTTFFYPLVVVTICAKIVGDKFTHGIYDEHIFLNHIPLVESHMERPEMNMMTAGDVMNSNCVMLRETLSVSELIIALQNNPYQNSLIVVDSNKKLKGILLRRTALILIDRRAWEADLDLEDFKKTAKEREYLKLKKYGFFERVPKEADHKLIDLRRYIDLWPYQFLPSAPLPRVYRTFRELGLRHIIVVNEDRQPLGVIGRKQLTYLEMTDPRTLPPEEQRTGMSILLSGDFGGDQDNDAGSPITLQSWRGLDRWQEAYKKGVN